MCGFALSDSWKLRPKGLPSQLVEDHQNSAFTAVEEPSAMAVGEPSAMAVREPSATAVGEPSELRQIQ